MNLPKIDRRGMNHKARRLFANRAGDIAPDVLAALEELLAIRNRHDPVFGIHVDRDRRSRAVFAPELACK